MTAEERHPFGRLVRGSLSRGLEVRLDDGQSIEALRAGQFVVLRGQEHEFFGMVTDLALGSVNDDPLHAPPPPDPLSRMIRGTALYGTATVHPSLMLSLTGTAGERRDEPQPAKTVPAHFSLAYSASASDVARVFGEDTGPASRYFEIGSPLEMEGIPVCIDVDRLVERSTGIFGKSGTGKTFLTRLALASIMRNTAAAAPVTLVFDMHNEYGLEGTAENDGRTQRVRGLKDLFGGGRIEVFAVSRRGARPVDFDVRIPYSQIEPADILLLHEELKLNRTAAESAYLAERRFGRAWFARLVGDEEGDLAGETGANEASLSALRTKLRALQHHCRDFLVPDAQIADQTDAVERILANVRGGKHTIVEFGACRMPLQYILVANILSRRLHGRYVDLTEAHQTSAGEAPRPLVIVLEEAHKFLSAGLAEQTIFGTIAREMRKYSVTLLVIDQRPSGIDPEIVSQLGTKMACLLDNERDMDAVLSGVSQASGLRGVLASLATRKQALIVGHAVPMPVVIDTRDYGSLPLLRPLGERTREERSAAVRQELREIFSR